MRGSMDVRISERYDKKGMRLAGSFEASGSLHGRKWPVDAAWLERGVMPRMTVGCTVALERS